MGVKRRKLLRAIMTNLKLLEFAKTKMTEH